MILDRLKIFASRYICNKQTQMVYTTLDHPEVQQELLEIVRDRKQFRSMFWLSWVVALVVNAALLSALVAVVHWLLGGAVQLAAVAITCTAYVCAILGVAMVKLHTRVSRMEMHALTVHNEILATKELAKEMHWKS